MLMDNLIKKDSKELKLTSGNIGKIRFTSNLSNFNHPYLVLIGKFGLANEYLSKKCKYF